MSIVTEDGGRTNIYAKEPEMYSTQEDLDQFGIEPYAVKAERLNGRWAMIGIVSGLVSYAITGNFFFGIV